MNYARLFAEAVAESVRDDLVVHPERLVAVYWQVRLHRNGPWVPACTFWCDHEPGEPDNKLDRWPYLVGELLGEPADPIDVLAARWRRPLVARGGLTINQEYAFQIELCRHAAEYLAAARVPLAQPRRAANLRTMKAIEP